MLIVVDSFQLTELSRPATSRALDDGQLPLQLGRVLVNVPDALLQVGSVCAEAVELDGCLRLGHLQR